MQCQATKRASQVHTLNFLSLSLSDETKSADESQMNNVLKDLPNVSPKIDVCKRVYACVCVGIFMCVCMHVNK